MDKPVGNISLSERLVKDDFSTLLGKRIKIYFTDKNLKTLKPQYRAIKKKEIRIATTIIEELADGPMNAPDSRQVIPDKVPTDKIRVWMEGRTAVVDFHMSFMKFSQKIIGD